MSFSTCRMALPEKRLEGCRNAILSGVPAVRVCTDFGYHDYSFFYRSFRKKYGVSPKEYADMYASAAAESQS